MVPSATAFFCCFIVAVHSIDGEGSEKFKRDAVSGLVSFPRIGRSDRLWKFGPQELKRQSLVSFPRTGKRDLTDVPTDADYPRRADLSWLPPRPGQSDRRENANDKAWALVQWNGVPVLLARTETNARRMLGESSEDAA